jgi:hypothetical protein
VTTLLDGHDSVHGSGRKFVCSPNRPHWFWDQNRLQFNGHQRPLPWK